MSRRALTNDDASSPVVLGSRSSMSEAGHSPRPAASATATAARSGVGNCGTLGPLTSAPISVTATRDAASSTAEINDPRVERGARRRRRTRRRRRRPRRMHDSLDDGGQPVGATVAARSTGLAVDAAVGTSSAISSCSRGDSTGTSDRRRRRRRRPGQRPSGVADECDPAPGRSRWRSSSSPTSISSSSVSRPQHAGVGEQRVDGASSAARRRCATCPRARRCCRS